MQAIFQVTADVAEFGALLVEARKLAGLPAVDAPQLPTSPDESGLNEEATTVEAEERTDEDGQEA